MEATSSGDPPSPAAEHHTIFSLMLAALLHSPDTDPSNKRKKTTTTVKTKTNCNSKKHSYHHQLQLQLITQMRLSLLSRNPNPSSSPPVPSTLPNAILALLPLLLNCNCAEVVRECADFVGKASLFSLEMNEQIANDDETVRGLVSVISNSRRSTSAAACNAVLDMSSTSVGRHRLLEFSALNCIIFCFLQASNSSTVAVALLGEEKEKGSGRRIGIKENEHQVLLLDAAVSLINTCTTEQIKKIPKNLSEKLLAMLKNLWANVRQQLLSATTLNNSQRRHFCSSNIRTSTLAECIFKLSVGAELLTTSVQVDVINKGIFSRDGSSFEQFVSNHWEVCPLLIRKHSRPLNEQSDIFYSFKQSLNLERQYPSFLSLILKNLVSCPPIASDELEILSFLEEVRSHLGSPMIYQQDIRVVKTEHKKGEVHFFQGYPGSCCFQDPQYLRSADILRCEEAFREGYTIALRGMEFRFGSIASIVGGLASLFGQPSAGVNMYLTPPNSQGLACHFDDHCVLVCQIVGVKQWTVYPRSSLQLPRLYEPIDSLNESDLSVDGCKHFLLKEGEILYIPRGFPHKACTIEDNDRQNEAAEFSLHLTLAIEVEAPFEWEGFIHISLHNWYHNQKQCGGTSDDKLPRILQAISVKLMHIMISLIGDMVPAFRKACLAGSVPSVVSNGRSGLDLNQSVVFTNLIKIVDSRSQFSDALKRVKFFIHNEEDPWQRFRWLQHLDDGNKYDEVRECNIPLLDGERLVLICDHHRDEAETAFSRIKSRFCSDMVFGDVKPCYMKVLEKYRKVRKEYMAGMLSLQCSD